MIHSINRNIFWADLLVDLLENLEIKNVVVAPGSRSTPLVFAFHKSKVIKSTIIVDERTAGFFALGLSKASGKATVLVTTSGTAVSELYPSIIEAYNQRVPLIVCTADRPLNLYNTGANQTINQIHIYKNHVRHFKDFESSSITNNSVVNFTKAIYHSLTVATKTEPGPVHLNFHFTKPFEPDSVTDRVDIKILKNAKIPTPLKINFLKKNFEDKISKKIISEVSKIEEGIFIVGNGQFSKTDMCAIIKLAETLNYPIFADGTSPFRLAGLKSDCIVTNYVAFLRTRKISPKIILQFGSAPTSNVLLNFFKLSKSLKYGINPTGDLLDPSKTTDKIFKIGFQGFSDYVISKLRAIRFKRKFSFWIEKIKEYESIIEVAKRKIIFKAAFPFEGRINIELLNCIPEDSNLFVSNSTSVRDVDFFAPTTDKNINLFTNRGASGIDGIISTTLGIAKNSGTRTYLLIGDLAFFHDLNSLWIAKEYKIPITIILCDNRGGGVFEMLPIVKHQTVFSKYFKTSLNLDFSKLVKSFDGNYSKITSWSDFRKKVRSAKNNKRFTVLHIKTNSKKSFALRKKFWDHCVNELENK